MNVVVEIRGRTTSFAMTKDLILGLCVRQDEGEFIPLSALNEHDQKVMKDLFLQDVHASCLWGDELRGA